MNCYACFIETGSESRPALAICQRCGAGMCKAHLVESSMPQFTGLAGERRAFLICSRCSVNIAQSTRLAGSSSSKQVKKPTGYSNVSRWNFWRWLRPQQKSDLPDPSEAVRAVKHFLDQQRKQ